MFSSLDSFIRYIPGFDTLSSGALIPYFVYYFIQCGNPFVTPKMIRESYSALSLAPYSNISSYLSNKSTGKNAIFIKKATGYTLARAQRVLIEKALLIDVSPLPTNDLLDLSILSGSPYYLVRASEQMNCCYDQGLFDACLVMMRKLFETLIIECFERYNCALEITDPTGHFFSFSELISRFLSSKHWSVSRNFEEHVKRVKKLGDLSAHNRRFLAKKSDIDGFKLDLRQCVQEIILMIDYPHWDRGTQTV